MKLGRELEKKYLVPNWQATQVRSHLDSLFPKDPEFPQANIYSLYFDNQHFSSLNEKINSDFNKRKIRIRWYEDCETKIKTEAYLEIKEKFGEHRHKIREKVNDNPPNILSSDLFSNQDFFFIGQYLKKYYPTQDLSLKPLLIIKYTRYRFLLPPSLTRICFDFNIQVVAANPQVFRQHFLENKLEEAVFELKGELRDLPPELYFLFNKGIYKGSFSKYARCIEKMINDEF